MQPESSTDLTHALNRAAQLSPYTAAGLLQVVVETPGGSRNKYTFEGKPQVLILKKTLPAGMVFPFDFGFVPSTEAGDGDPIDVLLLHDEPTFPGCVVEARVVGVITGENQAPGGETYRNDRILAVAEVSHRFARVHSLGALDGLLVRQFCAFFEAYPELLGAKTYRVLSVADKAEADHLIEAAGEQARARNSESAATVKAGCLR